MDKFYEKVRNTRKLHPFVVKCINKKTMKTFFFSNENVHKQFEEICANKIFRIYRRAFSSALRGAINLHRAVNCSHTV